MRIYPAPHYTMGGLWVDYNLMSNIPGLYVVGEANFSDHGANRLGASALMQGLADGYFVLPVTIGDYLAGAARQEGRRRPSGVRADAGRSRAADREAASTRRGSAASTPSTTSSATSCGSDCGMARTAEGLEVRDRRHPRLFASSTGATCASSAANDEPNQALEKAGRVADFFDLGELMCIDALQREESAGGHFRVEYQTADGEAKRNDDDFLYVGAWEFNGDNAAPELHKEPLVYEEVKLATRSYK